MLVQLIKCYITYEKWVIIKFKSQAIPQLIKIFFTHKLKSLPLKRNEFSLILFTILS